jgi:ABC-type uncharacterized transport system permease subunit
VNIVFLTTIWSIFTAGLYALSSITIIRTALDSKSSAIKAGYLPAAIGAGSHALILSVSVFSNDQININLGLALSFVAWIVVVMYLIGLRRQPVATLGVILLPFAAFVVIVTEFLPGPAMTLDHVNPVALSHALIAIMAYGLLSLALCQAILIIIQERHFRNKTAGTFFHALPSMEQMNSILFGLIIAGFSLLTIALVSGSFFTQQVFGTPFKFTHHIVLSILGWFAFGTLLIARYVWGWRGQVAAIWTVSSFSILVLAYFGARFVVEIILNK